jgi:hypothetical protein
MSKREPAPQPDPRLDRYRKAAARLYDGDVLAGHLLTRVNVWWTTHGPWWRRRGVDPQERVEWYLDFQPGFELAHPSGWDDGVDADPAELDQDYFQFRGRRLRVVWLDGGEAEEKFRLNGWERHD